MTDNIPPGIRAAADQFGAAIADAFKLGMRQAVAKQFTEDYGPGPWVLHPDGRVETIGPQPKMPGGPFPWDAPDPEPPRP